MPQKFSGFLVFQFYFARFELNKKRQGRIELYLTIIPIESQVSFPK